MTHELEMMWKERSVIEFKALHLNLTKNERQETHAEFWKKHSFEC
jgi:hypothetical protein